MTETSVEVGTVIIGAPVVRPIERVNVGGIDLANLIVPVALDENHKPVLLQTSGADVVHWLSVRHALLQSIHHVSIWRRDQFVSGLFALELILFSQFSNHRPQSLAKLEVRHVRGGQLRSKIIQKFCGFGVVGRFSRRKKPFDSLCRFRSFSGHSQSCRRKAHQALNLTEIHSSHPRQHNRNGCYRGLVVMSKCTPGYIQTSHSAKDTGGRWHVHDLHQENSL